MTAEDTSAMGVSLTAALLVLLAEGRASADGLSGHSQLRSQRAMLCPLASQTWPSRQDIGEERSGSSPLAAGTQYLNLRDLHRRPW